MSQHAFLLTAGVVFLLIALGHLIRILFSITCVVEGTTVPMWPSGLAVVVMGYLAYQSLRLARKTPS